MDEFHSSVKITDMLTYLDGYPLELPCRYANRVACYTKVYIVSNIPLQAQYPNVQRETLSVWQAFLRRINRIIEYTDMEVFNEYTFGDGLELTSWQEISDTGDLTF